MNDLRKILILLFLVLVSTSNLIYAVSAQENQTNGGITGTDIIVEAQRSLDRSLDILDTVATLMGVLVALITIIVMIAGAKGFFDHRKWNAVIQDMEKELEQVKNDSDAVRKDAEYIREIRKRVEEDAKKLRSETEKSPFTSLTERPSEEQMKKLDEFVDKLDMLEILGASLKPDDYHKRANDLYYKGKYEEALAAYEKAIELKPDYAEAWDNKGVTLGKLGRNEKALEAHEKAIELKPDYTEAWDNKGVTLGKLGRNEKALEAHEKAIELKPDDAEAWYNKGVTLGKLGRHDEALAAYDKAIELKPDYAKAWFNRACSYTSKGNKGNALSDLKKAAELDPSSKEKAKKDKDFEKLWGDEKFKEIVK